jgi:hypothetical protein
MLAKCANPSCSAPFLYLREGKLYQMEVVDDGCAGAPDNQPGPGAERKPVRRLEFFWLCGRCAAEMTLAFTRGRGVVVVPNHRQGAVAS